MQFLKYFFSFDFKRTPSSCIPRTSFAPSFHIDSLSKSINWIHSAICSDTANTSRTSTTFQKLFRLWSNKKPQSIQIIVYNSQMLRLHWACHWQTFYFSTVCVCFFLFLPLSFTCYLSLSTHNNETRNVTRRRCRLQLPKPSGNYKLPQQFILLRYSVRKIKESCMVLL